MRRKVAVILILIGLLFAGWNGFTWLFQMSSGKEEISANDLVKVDRDEKISIDNTETPVTHKKTTPVNNSSSALKDIDKNTSEQVEENIVSRDYKEYTRGEKVGWLLIPSLGNKYPIYWGTDDETLTQGVGNYVGKYTTPPDGLGHTVLSGHRDTVFQELGNLKEDDRIFVQFEGMQYEYKIKRTWVTDAEDRTVIVEKDEPVLTLTTCYPFSFIGAAPDRFIIEAPLVGKTKM